LTPWWPVSRFSAPHSKNGIAQFTSSRKKVPMSDNEKKQSQKPAASTETAADADLGQKEVQEAFDEANEQGYFGVTTDPTPDENYTLQGQAAGKPTPETDPKQAAEVRAFQAEMGRDGRDGA